VRFTIYAWLEQKSVGEKMIVFDTLQMND
jgi:hypothetical protein